MGEARKTLDKLEGEAPVAAYHAAIAAQLDDDVIAAEKHIALYVKSNPADPAGRALQTEIVCALDLNKCNSILETVRSTDDAETAIARRLGAAVSGPAVVTRARFSALARDADTLSSASFSDALGVAALLREGADPAAILVRSPRSGRPEPAPGVDLVKQAKPITRLPFATRVVQLASLNDPAASTAHSRMAALFPTEFATWRLARRWDRTATSARKELERAPFTRWRAMVATVLARTDELCELSQAFPWTDRGPIANSTRARCEISLDATRGRKIAEARLAVQPYGQLDVETAIEGHAAVKDSNALEALGRSLIKSAPMTTLPALALWASADVGSKKSHALFAEAIGLAGWDPAFSRRLVQKYVEAHDVAHAKAVIPESLVESPLDAYLCGVYGEILLHEGKPADALPWLTKSCIAARARKEQDVLASTLSSLASAVGKAKAPKDKPARDAALKCAKGD
jgi:predicted Zn-dependent protease